MLFCLIFSADQGTWYDYKNDLYKLQNILCALFLNYRHRISFMHVSDPGPSDASPEKFAPPPAQYLWYKYTVKQSDNHELSSKYNTKLKQSR